MASCYWPSIISRTGIHKFYRPNRLHECIRSHRAFTTSTGILSTLHTANTSAGLSRSFDPLTTKAVPLLHGLSLGTRFYSFEPPASPEDIEKRILLVLKLYDKILNKEELNLDCHFYKDLGLDSLDQIEIMMMMEDEFGIEIPDADADRLLTPRDLFEFVCDEKDVIFPKTDSH